MGLCVKAKDVTAYGALVYSRLLIKRHARAEIA